MQMRLVRKPDPRDGWYEITPAVAQSLLSGRWKNRPLKEFRAQKISDDIRARRFRENGESMVLSETGQLLDGQHRCRAVVLANQSAVIYCVFGVSRAVFATFDQGATRGGSDLAGLMGFKNYALVAATARLAIRYAEGMATVGRLPQEILREYFKKHEVDLTDAVAEVVAYREGLVHLVPMAQICFLYHAVRQSSPGIAKEFVEKLSTGAGLRPGDPVLIFRRRLQELQGKKDRLGLVERLALLIKTWNAFVQQKPLGVLRWSRAVEQFPAIEFADAGGK